MRTRHARWGVLALVAMLAASGLRADPQCLDEAARALSAKDTERAVELYRQANRNEPTVAGCNNLGVALERSGRFAEAAAAYEEAVRLAGADPTPRRNLLRARIRALVRRHAAYAKRVFLLVTGLFAVRFVIRMLRAGWRRMARRVRLRSIRLAGLAHYVHCSEKTNLPGGWIYPDTEALVLEADIHLPDCGKACPLDLVLVRPDGTAWRTFCSAVKPGAARRLGVQFCIDPIDELMELSGTWGAVLVLRDLNRVLGRTAFRVIGRDELIAELEVVDRKVIALRGDGAEPVELVLADTDAVAPCATICAPNHPGNKFCGIPLRLELVRTDAPCEPEVRTYTLELTGRTMAFCPASRPVAGDPIAAQSGHWEFRLWAGRRLLARMPFAIATLEQARDSIRIESFDIAGINADGRTTRLATMADPRSLRTLCPVITLATGFPSRNIGYGVSVGVCADGQPIGAVDCKVTFSGKTTHLTPGEFVLAAFDPRQDLAKIDFVLILEGKPLGTRSVKLRKSRPRCADAQGCLIHVPPESELDYEGEARRILRQAKAKGAMA